MPFETIAVTGGSGRVGRYLVEELRQHWHVKVLDRAPYPETAGVSFLHADIMDVGQLRRALVGVDAVVHLAGVDLDRAEAPENTVGVNVMGSWHVLQVCRELRIKRVVFCSSVTASGLPEVRNDAAPQWLPVDESHPDKPVNPYGVSKLAVETLARSFTQTGQMSVLCLRAMMVALPENIAPLQEKAKNQDTRWTFSYIGPEDLARAFVCALTANDIQFGVFYITAEDSCTREPTLDFVQRVYGELPSVKDTARYQSNPNAALFDGTAAKRSLGFQPRQCWQDFVIQAKDSVKPDEDQLP